MKRRAEASGARLTVERRVGRLVSSWCVALWLLVACGSGPKASSTKPPVSGQASTLADQLPPDAPLCPETEEAELPLPGVRPEHLQAEYWLERWSERMRVDRTLLSVPELRRHNASLSVPRPGYFPQRSLLEPLDWALVQKEVEDRHAWALEKLGEGDFVDARGQPLSSAELAGLGQPLQLGASSTDLRVVLEDTLIRCAPVEESFYPPSLDLRLDRNACSQLRAQQPVRVIARYPNGMQLVQAAFSFGWLSSEARLSPPVPKRFWEVVAQGPRRQLMTEDLDLPESPRSAARTSGHSEKVRVRAGAFLPALSERTVVVGTRAGFQEVKLAADRLRSVERALTPRALLLEAFSHLGKAYGLGGSAGGLDCSRFLLDVFASFNLDLPRHSTWQSLAGSFFIDVAPELTEEQRLALMDAALAKGPVLLYFPGHIMLYLGRDAQGQPMALHSFGEYLSTCPAGTRPNPAGETLRRVPLLTVSNLELGRSTSRRAFIERITRIAVIGEPPGLELSGVAHLRPPAPLEPPADEQCQDTRSAALYVLPELPNAEQALRVAAVLEKDPGPARLSLFDAEGQAVEGELVRAGGPPFGQVLTLPPLARGHYKAVLGDGDRVLSCQRLYVRKRRPKPAEPHDGPVWDARWSWHQANENLYALFVERLFDFPAEQDLTWPNLHTLLRDPARNILYDYRGLKEEEELELQPDCADLPYTLRAYFAWKLRLPFGFRRCTRARDGKPPNCNKEENPVNFVSNLMSRLELGRKESDKNQPRGDVDAFQSFVYDHMRLIVHSSSARTLPEDEMTDFYPVDLTREALKPGTVFADPYGHLLVISDWQPQGATGHGMLMGVDAQPDGTVGRRRFWRGSFLFDPDTRSGGPGFKAFRPRKLVEEPVVVELSTGVPVVVDDAAVEGEGAQLPGTASGPAAERTAEPAVQASRSAPEGSPLPATMQGDERTEVGSEEAAEEPLTVKRVGFLEDEDNEALRRTRVFRKLSLKQYEGSASDFYQRMEALINPRPLDPVEAQLALIDAFAESVSRRVTSVKNGERWIEEHPEQTMVMPEGANIFLSSGPWEDFSTPSRDLRLLISIDSVLGFSDSVKAAPQRFGVKPEALDAALEEVAAVLQRELATRRFEYERSNGKPHSLTLQQLVERVRDLEMAYNPNDCIEIRWGAPPGSKEYESCSRHAPEEQRQRMQQVRNWFAQRRRPAR